MYKMTFVLSNPIANESVQCDLQFDPAGLDQTQWANMYAFVREKIDALVDRSAASEPQKWSEAIAAAAKPAG